MNKDVTCQEYKYMTRTSGVCSVIWVLASGFALFQSHDGEATPGFLCPKTIKRVTNPPSTPHIIFPSQLNHWFHKSNNVYRGTRNFKFTSQTNKRGGIATFSKKPIKKHTNMIW